jgi:hypothetical protein
MVRVLAFTATPILSLSKAQACVRVLAGALELA